MSKNVDFFFRFRFSCCYSKISINREDTAKRFDIQLLYVDSKAHTNTERGRMRTLCDGALNKTPITAEKHRRVCQSYPKCFYGT